MNSKTIKNQYSGVILDRLFKSLLRDGRNTWNFGTIVIILLLNTCTNSHTARCQERRNTPSGLTGVHEWVDQHFAKGKIPPFSFTYGGKSSDNFIAGWQFSADNLKPDKPDVNESVYTYTDTKSGLAVKCVVTWYNDFPAVEWVLKFSNNSKRNSPVIEKVNAIDNTFSYNKSGTFILHYANGCNSLRSDFRPYDNELKTGNSIYMTPNEGRSSSGDKAFPFFNIESPAGGGVMVAVGWTGKWFANILKEDEKSVSLNAGMERIQLTLFPQEEIRSPRICLLFWEGEDRMIGHNQFRRFILAHHTRKIKGKSSELPLSVILARGGPPPCSENTCTTESYAIALIDRYQQFNIVPEVFWIDAGWYINNGRWVDTGSWVVNKKNFPNGLKPVSDAAHEVGAKFLLWFEPERVRKGTLLYNDHPEWLIGKTNSVTRLLNLGDKEALSWVTDHISELIKEEGIDIYRQDFNMDPMPYWEESDAPQRIGITEIRHIEGLYAFWDSLLVRFPNLIIDNCASGGRRIDFETVSRSSPLWRTDYHGYTEPNGSQDNTYGLNFYLPLHGTGNWVRSPYYFWSNMSSSMVLNWDINSSDCSQVEMQKYIQDFKRLRPYYCGDYYPLTGTDNFLKDRAWLAYQLDRPEQKDGIILVFRREDCMDDTYKIRLHGLDKKAIYELFYEDYKISVQKTGKELTDGFEVFISQRPSSLLISYRIIEK